MKQEIREKILGAKHSRMFTIKRAEEGKDAFTGVPFTSEAPYVRWYGIEVLSHAPECVRVERMNAGLPLLMDHERCEQVGRVENASIDPVGKRVVGDVRFSRSEDGQQLKMDIEDGIRPDVSCGYNVYSMRELGVDELSEELKTLALQEKCGVYLVDDWEPVEFSSVSMPADLSVGFGRGAWLDGMCEKDVMDLINKKSESGAPGEITITERKSAMTEEEKRLAAEQEKRSAEEREASRKTEIEAVAKRFADRFPGGVDALNKRAKEAIELGIDESQFRFEVYESIRDRKPLEANTFINMGERDKKNYSIRSAIMQAIPTEHGGMKPGLEAEATRALKQQLESQGIATRGNSVIIPYDVLSMKRDLSVSGGATAGGNVVGTTLMSFIDYLYDALLLPGMGATYMPGLVGNVGVPKLSGVSSYSWNAEGSNASTTDSTFAQLTLSPKELQAKEVFSKRLLTQSTPGVDQIIANMLIKQMALGIQAAAFHGTGASNQPTGITYTSNVGSVVGTGFGLAQSVEFESDVASANADAKTMYYAMNAVTRGALKQRFVNVESSERLIMNDVMNGYGVKMTNAVASRNIIFGDWSNLIIGEWGIMELVLDYLTLGPSQVKVTSYQMIDIGVAKPQGFSVCTDFN